MDNLINKVLSYFWEKIISIFKWLVDTLLIPFRWLLDGLFWIVSHVVYYVFDGFLTAVSLSFEAIDFSSVLFSNTLGDDLHPALCWFIVELGLPQCFTLIGVAVGIRMLLNLLPAAVTRI